MFRISALFLLVVVAAGAVTVWAQRRWSTTLDERRVSLLSLSEVANIRLALADQESGMRGFALSGVPSFLDPYENGRAAFDRWVEAFRISKPNPQRDARIHQLVDAATQWRRDFAEPIIATRRSGAVASEQMLQGSKTKFDDIRGLLDAETARQEANFRTIDQRVDHLGSLASFLNIAWLAIALLIALLVLWAFRQWVFKPLTAISEASLATARGQSVPFPRGAAEELNSVADAVETLQHSLSTERDRALRAYQTLEQSAVLALHVRGALVGDAHVDYGHGWKSHTAFQPAAGSVAGDCYDIGLVNHGLIYVMMVDVTGHGPVAALNALQAKTFLKSVLRGGADPATALQHLYDQYGQRGEIDYLTAFLATVSMASGKVRYANAGHPPPLLQRPGDLGQWLGATGPLIGPLFGEWRNGVAVLDPGDMLLIYTDGLTETRDGQRQALGEEWLAERVAECAHPELLCTELIETASEFRHGAQEDDVSLVLLQRDHLTADPAPGTDPSGELALPRVGSAG